MSVGSVSGETFDRRPTPARSGIVGALANLGYEVSDQTVGNVLKRLVISSPLKCSRYAVCSPTTFCSASTWRPGASKSPASTTGDQIFGGERIGSIRP